MSIRVSCAFAPSAETPGHIAVAEALGYERAWCYDSPSLYSDVWATLAVAAIRTSQIGLGPAVLVPSLRHPMVNAAALAGLAVAAPGRVAAAVGAGFTGRYTLGQRPMRWAEVEAYVRALRALLRGEDVTWEGTVIAMLERDPVDVPILVGADGPKGREVATAVGDGIFTSGQPASGSDLPPWRAMLAFGTVVDDGEALADERVLAAAGHAVAVVYHATYERRGAAGVDALPGGQQWRRAVEDVDGRRRHLAVHEGHLVRVTERDRAAVLAGAGMLPTISLTGSPAELRAKVGRLVDAGVTEIAYQPAGSDIPGELERFIGAVG